MNYQLKLAPSLNYIYMTEQKQQFKKKNKTISLKTCFYLIYLRISA